MSKRTKRLEGALAREKHKREFYGFTHDKPARETMDDILEEMIVMSKMLDHLMPDRSDDI